MRGCTQLTAALDSASTAEQRAAAAQSTLAAAEERAGATSELLPRIAALEQVKLQGLDASHVDDCKEPNRHLEL